MSQNLCVTQSGPLSSTTTPTMCYTRPISQHHHTYLQGVKIVQFVTQSEPLSQHHHTGYKVRYTMCYTIRTCIPAPPHLFTVKTYVPAPPHLFTKVRYTMCNTVGTYVPAPPHLVTSTTTPSYKVKLHKLHNQNLCPSTTTPSYKVRFTICNTVRTYFPAPPHLFYKGNTIQNLCPSTTTPGKIMQSVTQSEPMSQHHHT
ncbi:unnamed protein product [Mytilus edulis]|uniref:Uncharacterized protein n=1 Tax=Mytilus edulis TaxID=6550 RepID=A0A8S3STQ1_MYTED|nr:unnamed protein product [Mytilus edulis]